MASISACFSESRAEARPSPEARRRPRQAALALVVQPRRARPGGELLLSRHGAVRPQPDAPRMLVLIAGTHGVEGHCGFGAEIVWLKNGGPAKLPDNHRRPR